jgi:hypothetical protein
VRRVLFVLVLAGCGYSGFGTGGSPTDGGASDAGKTIADGAPDPGFDSGSVQIGDSSLDGPVDSAPVSCASGAFCRANGRCFSDCGQNDSCPGQPETCVACVLGVPFKTCGASCGSSQCGCFTAENCPMDDELCQLLTCVVCDNNHVGARCSNGERCLKCDDNTYHCAGAPDKC